MTIGKVIISIGRAAIWFVSILLILKVLKVDITPILAGAGILGLAVGLGAQRLVSDFINGFFILFEDRFNVGEIVEIESFTGEVMDIGLRTTTIKNWNGVLKVMGNGVLRSVINHCRHNSIAIVDFKVSYETDLGSVGAILNDHFKNKKYTNGSLVDIPEYIGAISFNDSEITCRVVSTCRPFEHFQFERDLRSDIKVVLESNNIYMPYPHLVIKKEL